MTDIGSIRSRLSSARRVRGPPCCIRLTCGDRCGRPAPGPPGRRSAADGALGGAFGFGFGAVVVAPENEAPTFAARPRALLAAPATAAIGEVDVGEVDVGDIRDAGGDAGDAVVGDAGGEAGEVDVG